MGLEEVIEYLIKGDISFFDLLDDYMISSLADCLHGYPDREKLLNNSYNELKEKYPGVVFVIAYDMEGYEDFCKQYLEKNKEILLNYRFFHEFLGSSNWATDYVFNNLDYFLRTSLKDDAILIFSIIKYCVSYDMKRLKDFIYYDDINIRGLIMSEILDNFPVIFSKLYPNILEYCAKYDDDGNVIELMNQSCLSKIAALSLNVSKEQYILVRDFIFRYYVKNDIALELNRLICNDDEYAKDVLIEDIDILFETSRNFKWHLYREYGDNFNNEVLENFENKCAPFMENPLMLQHMFFHELSDKYFEFVDKYLSLSTGAKCIRFETEGSCTLVYKVGDYALKYSLKKYSNDEEICPNLYLVAKNIEEIFIRDTNGYVTAAIEVQQYLNRPVMETQIELIEKFKKEFEKLGYWYDDVLVGGMCGTNCFYLNDYHDADCENPEKLPEWFKEDPIVLVDRDTVLKL